MLFLPPMDNKRTGLRVSFAFFQREYLLDGRLNKSIATIEDLSDLSKAGDTDGVPPFLMKRSCI